MDGGDDFDDFFRFANEIADGQRWELISDAGWDDFERRLAVTVGHLTVRRRQAVMMLLFALLEGFVRPEDVRRWTGTHDLGDDAEVEALIAWLRQERPKTT